MAWAVNNGASPKAPETATLPPTSVMAKSPRTNPVEKRRVSGVLGTSSTLLQRWTNEQVH
jgi:hypothetical protein